MQLRKVCSHPFLLPGVEDNVTGGGTLSPADSLKALVSASGKVSERDARQLDACIVCVRMLTRA